MYLLSHSPCKPGNGLLQKQQQQSISGAPGTKNPQTKTTSYSTGLAQKKIICSITQIKKELKCHLLSKVENT